MEEILIKNHFEVNGEVTSIFVKRRNGEVLEILIDTNDLELVHERYPNSWTVAIRKGNPYGYGQRKGTYFYLHRVLLDAKKDEIVDHINHNTLDNRRENLRIVDINGNNQNLKGARKNNETGLRGVHRVKRTGKYTAHVSGKHLGTFSNKYEAAIVAEKFRSQLGYLTDELET